MKKYGKYFGCIILAVLGYFFFLMAMVLGIMDRINGSNIVDLSVALMFIELGIMYILLSHDLKIYIMIKQGELKESPFKFGASWKYNSERKGYGNR